MSDYELLELILFRAIPQRDVKPLAKQLIATFGSLTAVLAGLAAHWIFDLSVLEGMLIGAAVAATDSAAIFAVLRRSTLEKRLARSLEDAALTRRGTVNNWSLSARAIAFIIAGHFQHHVNILRDRYSIAL